MANWCVNYFRLEWDVNHPQAPLFENKIKVYQRLSTIEHLRYKGVTFNAKENDYLHDLCYHDPLVSGEITGQFETKWNSLTNISLQLLLEKFPCILSVAVDYEEPSNQYAGILNACREFDEVVVTRSKARDVYWVLTSMRDMSFDAPYVSMEDCMERTECTREEIEAALAESRCTLEDFSENMECFDFEDYVR